MPAMHEWEARMRHVEECINRLFDLALKLADQLGQVQQNQQMDRKAPGFGKAPKNTISAVVTTAISLAPDANTLGEGAATLRDRDDVDLTDGRTGVRVLSNFSVEVPIGTRIEVAPDGNIYKLVASDCF